MPRAKPSQRRSGPRSRRPGLRCRAPIAWAIWRPAHASTIKVFGTEFYLEACRLMLEVMGAAGNLRPGSPDAALGGRVGQLVRAIHILTFGGGVNEMQRDLIALFGLGMPVAPRF